MLLGARTLHRVKHGVLVANEKVLTLAGLRCKRLRQEDLVGCRRPVIDILRHGESSKVLFLEQRDITTGETRIFSFASCALPLARRPWQC